MAAITKMCSVISSVLVLVLHSDRHLLTIYDSDDFHKLIAAHIILVNCSILLLDFCDAAALILSTVFHLLKQVALSFVSTSCRMITAAHTTVSVV